MRVAVIGATGNMGTALLRRLAKARGEVDGPVEIVGIARRLPDSSRPPYDGVQWHSIDIAGADAVEQLSRGEAPGLQLVLVTALVSGFLWMGAGAAIRNGQLRQRLPGVTAGALMRPALGIRSGSPVQQARALLAAHPNTALVVTAPTGQPEALVDAGALAQVPPHLAETTPVNATARALAAGAYVPDAARGEELVQYLSRLSGGEYAVIDRDGAVVGLLLEADVVRAVTGRPARR